VEASKGKRRQAAAVRESKVDENKAVLHELLISHSLRTSPVLMARSSLQRAFDHTVCMNHLWSWLRESTRFRCRFPFSQNHPPLLIKSGIRLDLLDSCSICTQCTC
jgi:hypothetical protein